MQLIVHFTDEESQPSSLAVSQPECSTFLVCTLVALITMMAFWQIGYDRMLMDTFFWVHDGAWFTNQFRNTARAARVPFLPFRNTAHAKAMLPLRSFQTFHAGHPFILPSRRPKSPCKYSRETNWDICAAFFFLIASDLECCWLCLVLGHGQFP